MSSAESSRPMPPAQRDLRSPYFLFRTPDGLGSYFTAENLPLVLSPREPLARFLAPARMTEAAGLRTVAYDLGAVPLDTARPMDHLPQSEIDAFAAAVSAFYSRAHAAAERVVPHEKRLRAHFRLPDPQMEPDAYWVYGPAHDRRLLILWGVERVAGTSLPLAPDAELKLAAGQTLLDRLQDRVMSWEARQREAMRFALSDQEPISRFLARRAVDARGTPVGVSCQGRTIEAKRLRPMRRIYTRECAAFDRAAKAFYDRAEAAGTGPYEKEIRRAFRLPDPDGPGAYFLAGQRPVIVIDGAEPREATLPLIDHPVVNRAADEFAEPAGKSGRMPLDSTEDRFPAPDSGPVVVSPARPPRGATVSEKLRARSISSALVAGAGVAAAVLAAAGLWGGWQWARDLTPPKVVESAEYPAALDATHIAVKFSKPIDLKSVTTGAAAKPSFAFGDDAARVESVKADAKDSSKLILTTTPLTDGKIYPLTVDALADRHGHRLAEATSVSFRYLDLVPPSIQALSAGDHANQLMVVFSKPVAEASIARGGSYQLFALEAGGEGAPQRIASGRLDPGDPAGRTVLLDAVKDFIGNQPYRLESVAGVTDTSVSRNPVALPARGIDFPYRDILPPRVRGITASVNKLELTLTFSKPVDASAALDLGNYAANGPDQQPLSFLPGTAALDPTGRSVTLRFAPVRLGLGLYHLGIKSMADRLGNRTPAPLAVAFEFADPDRSPLKVASHSLVAADNHVENQVTLTYSRALDPDEAIKASNYTLLGADRTPLDTTVVEARRVPGDPASVLLILSQSPTAGVGLRVHATHLADIFGQRAEGPIDYAFTPPGIPDPTEQVLGWSASPTLKGRELELTIKEAVSRPSALLARNFVLSAADAHVDRVVGYRVLTDPATGARRTQLKLQVTVPEGARRNLSLRARDLRADGLEFLGAQRLQPAAVALL